MNAHSEGFICGACDAEYDAYAIKEYNVHYAYVGDMVLCDCCVTDFNNGLDHLMLSARKLRGNDGKTKQTRKITSD